MPDIHQSAACLDNQKIKVSAFRKLSIASDIFRFSYEVKKHQLRKSRPELTEEQLHLQTIELIRRACK